MKKFSKEGIMVNKDKKDLLHSGSKETAIMISQYMNPERLYHKEDHSVPGM
jgi:hypothetical protein